MKKFSTLLLAVFLTVFLCGTASAISVNLVDGDWTNPVFSRTSTNFTINNSAESGGTSTIYWGTGYLGGPQSGYEFESVVTPFPVTADGELFALGDFTHANNPITASGGSLISVDLVLNLGITGLDPFAVTFGFDHNETPNDYGDYRDNDIVTILNPIVNKSFIADNMLYYFNLIGFSQDGGITVENKFSTVEDQINTATLYAKITSNPISVPEPATALLLGLGLCGLAILRKRP